MNGTIANKEGFTRIETGRIHWIETGKGDPVHFLHANGFCSGVYVPFFEHLADSFRILASDIRGHGDSEPAPVLSGKKNELRWEIFAEDLKELITTMMRPPVMAAGHSLGAVTTLIAAARYPELFSRIVLIDPVILPPWMLRTAAVMRKINLIGMMPIAKNARRRKKSFGPREEVLERFSGKGMFKSWSPEFINAYVDCAMSETKPPHGAGMELKCDPELEARIFESVPSNIWEYAAQVRCPVLVIGGENSDTFLPAAARKLQKVIKGAQIVTVPDAGHFVPIEKPGVVAALMKEFFASKEETRKEVIPV
ncbi:MAG: alpha/beta hydrolase [bacterium]|nr:alpha/beta hydrolase [bacterium]